MSQFKLFLESLKNYINDEFIDEISNAYTMCESLSDVNEMNEYFKGLKGDNVDKNKTLKSLHGNGRLSYRPGVGRGSLSYNPDNQMVATQNATVGGSSDSSSTAS